MQKESRMASKARGLYKDKDGWVMVSHPGGHEISTDKETYLSRGYEPPYESLPKEEDCYRKNN